MLQGIDAMGDNALKTETETETENSTGEQPIKLEDNKLTTEESPISTARTEKSEDDIKAENYGTPREEMPKLNILHLTSDDNALAGEPLSKSTREEVTPRCPSRRSARQAPVNEYGLPLGPAAGLGPQECSPTVPQNANNREIFSVLGTRSVKINRHRDSVTVFPSGCMGVKDDQIEEAAPIPSPMASSSTVPSINSTNYSRTESAASRNPLTGEGYADRDFIRQTTLKKRDGNPLLGQGYEEKKDSKPKRVPPGGFSKGLW